MVLVVVLQLGKLKTDAKKKECMDFYKIKQVPKKLDIWGWEVDVGSDLRVESVGGRNGSKYKMCLLLCNA